MSLDALLQNINRRQQSYQNIGMPSGRPRIQRISPMNQVPGPIPIGPVVVNAVPSPSTQATPLPFEGSVGLPQMQELAPPQLVGLEGPQVEGVPAPVSPLLAPLSAEEMAPPDAIGLADPEAEEVAPPEEVTATSAPTFFDEIVSSAKEGVTGIRNWASGIAQDDEKMGKLILALNSMRRKPDQGIAAAARDQIASARSKKTVNRTADTLEKQGTITSAEADLIRQGVKPKDVIAMRGKPVERKTSKDVHGRLRYQDTKELVYPDVAAKPAERKTLQDVQGRSRYQDTGKLVFPDVADKPVQTTDFDKRLKIWKDDPEEYKRLVEAGVFGKSGTTVNVDTGTIPVDMQAIRDDSGRIVKYEVIPGSKTDLARQAAEKATEGRTETKSTAASTVINSIAGLRSKLKDATWSSPVTGITGEILGAAGPLKAGSARADAEGYVQTIRSNVGFDRLQRMRDESPTGGALGNVSDLEVKTLQATIGDLNLNQSPEKIEEVLSEIERQYTNIMNKAAAYPNASRYGFTPQPANSDDDPLGIL